MTNLLACFFFLYIYIKHSYQLATVPLSSFLVFRLPYENSTDLTLGSSNQVKSYYTDGQSASLSWCQAPIWDQRLIFFLLSLIIFRQIQIQSRRYFNTDGQSVSMSWCRVPFWGAWPHFSFPFLLPENCFALRLGAPSLMRGRVCNL
jgi:hypothetical protein